MHFTLYKQNNPLYPKEFLLEGAEKAFKTIAEYNKDYPEADLRAYVTFLEYLKCDELKEPMEELIKKYNTDHIKLHEECHLILNEAGAEDKEPNMMAKMMGKLQSQMKLMSSGDTKKAAEILTDGCNMGMKTLSEFMNQYKNADSRAIMICEKIYQIEDQMMDELRAYL